MKESTIKFDLPENILTEAKKKYGFFKKGVLAFSGGLDTSFCISLLKGGGICGELVTVTVDTGGFSSDEIKTIEEKSKALGADKHYFIDGKNEVFQAVQYIIKGNILRGGNYPQSVAIERLATAKKIAEVVKSEGADAVIHGSTGAGNDQLRFDLAFMALLPQVNILAPVRDLNLTRNQETEYLKSKGVSVPEKTTKYSINLGMWGNSVGGAETQDPWAEIPSGVFPKSNSPDTAPDKSEYLVVSFEKGVPVSINSETMKPVDLIQQVTEIGNKHGIGRDVVLTTSSVGLKARIGIEVPAAHILIAAHKHLEGLTLTWEQIMIKDIVAGFYREYIHKGMLFDPVVKDIEALIDSSQKYVTGEVKLKLYKGNIITIGCKSPYTLKVDSAGAYGEQTSWSGEEAKGFAKILGLQGTIYHQVHTTGGEYDK